jgi:hypothetical protein
VQSDNKKNVEIEDGFFLLHVKRLSSVNSIVVWLSRADRNFKVDKRRPLARCVKTFTTRLK